MIRTEAGCSISRFAELVGVPRCTYHARLARHCAGDPPKEPWPAPVVDRIEATVAMHAAEWPAWGHRKIAAIAAAEGCDVGSASSVKRAMARRNLLQPVRYQAEVRQLAAARRETFVSSPVRRNRFWQTDFTSSRPPLRAPGGSAPSWTTPPNWPWRAPSLPHRAPPT